MGKLLVESLRKYFEGKIYYHQANVRVYLENPVGIGEHPDVMLAIEEELAKAAEYAEKLEMLNMVNMDHYG